MTREEIITFLIERRTYNPKLVKGVNRALFENDNCQEIDDIEALLRFIKKAEES